MDKMLNFIRKYRFPLHLFQAGDIITTKFSLFFSTLSLKSRLSLLGCRYGRNLRADGKVVIRIQRKGAVTFGNDVKILSRFLSTPVGITNPTVFQCIGEGRVTIGNNTGCTSTIFSARTSIRIGDNVKIGANVRIFDHDYHALDFMERRSPDLDFLNTGSDPVMIGDDVFIGTNTVILRGVNIGDRSIIGAAAVVSLREIPPDSLVAGNPASIIRRIT
jgi:acetyltransferase-like isoleucine patch superfamily enzyme